MTGNQSGAEKDNRLLFSKSKMAATNFNQSGIELTIQDGGTHENQPCWKTAHQPQRRTGIGLTDFHGDTNHARVSQKCHATSKSTWLTLINRSLFLATKLTTGLEGLRSLSQTRPICQLRINLYTCHSNVIQLYFSKILIFLQAGRVRFLVTRAH